MKPIYYAIPFFLITVALEWALLRGARKKGRRGYTRKDAFASARQKLEES